MTIVLSLFRSHWLAVVYCLVFCIGSCEPVHEDRTQHILCLSLVSKAERSDKTLTGIFMNKLGLKEPGFENRRTFSKKAREPQKLLRFKKFALVNVSQSRTVKQAFKTIRKSSTLVKKAISASNVSKIEQIISWQSDCKKDNAFVKIHAFILNTQ